MARDRRRFPTTSWPLVQEAAEATGRSPALEELLQRYLSALRAHLCQVKRIPADEAENLLQSFILDKLIQQQLIARADQRKGRFRTFLLTVLDNYVRNKWRTEATARQSTQALDIAGEHRDVPDEAQPSPDCAFDVSWAREVLTEAVRRMEQQCQDEGHAVAWEVFVSRILKPIWHNDACESYEALVRRLNLHTPAQAYNALATAKRMFSRAMRSVISEYARDEAEVDEEIADLRQILSKTPRNRVYADAPL